MKLFKLNYINIITFGGMGDALLATPSFKAIKVKNPDKKLRVFYLKRHKDIFLNNPYIDELEEASFIKSPVSWIMYYIGLLNIISIDYSFTKPSRNYNKNIISIIGEVLGVDAKPKDLRLFLSKKEIKKGKDILCKLPEKIVIISPYTISSENKLWFRTYWELLIEEMPEYTFVQLGLQKEPLIEGAVDLRGLKVRESMAVLNEAKCFVGVDSFLAHVATALKIPSIVLFGATPPNVFGHKQNYNLSSNELCGPCYEFLADSICPYNRRCMSGINVENVKNKIEYIMASQSMLVNNNNLKLWHA